MPHVRCASVARRRARLGMAALAVGLGLAGLHHLPMHAGDSKRLQHRLELCNAANAASVSLIYNSQSCVHARGIRKAYVTVWLADPSRTLKLA